MAADAPMGPMDAARSMEVENWDAPAEHWPADPVGHPTQMSDANYRARAEVHRLESNNKSPGLVSNCWWMRRAAEIPMRMRGKLLAPEGHD